MISDNFIVANSKDTGKSLCPRQISRGEKVENENWSCPPVSFKSIDFDTVH